MERLVQVINFGASTDDVSVLDLFDAHFIEIKLILEFAKELLNDIFHRNEPGSSAVLVDHNTDAVLVFLEFTQEFADIFGFRDKRRLFNYLIQRIVILENIIEKHHANDPIDGILVDR
ncbi:MAG: hypothetical protein MAGBODY4_00515 [Candidatus Marinimicrobia bacterium]|nr:hypothetical protein [Candidatus Neomarinimicrobiota bacterium]